MRVFDASSLIWAWDTFPIAQFPTVWAWLGQRAAAGEILIPQVAMDEVGHKAPDCATWLRGNGATVVAITPADLTAAQAVKAMLGIVNDAYSANGVDENDLLIIAVSKRMGAPLVSDEAEQKLLPKVLANCKIPAVCAMQGVAVECTKFHAYLRGSGRVF